MMITGIRSRPLSNSGTILVVDDVEVVRTFTAMVLKNQGYTVLEADRGFEALRIFSEQKDRIDLVLTDIRMPEMNGLELARQLTRYRPDIKVLFMSGYPSTDNVNFTLPEGQELVEPREDFLQKPFTPERLTRKVHETLKIK